MLFYILLLGAAPILGIYYMTRIFSCIATILKAVLIGIAAIILIPRLLSAAPVITALAALVALITEAKRIVGFLLG